MKAGIPKEVPAIAINRQCSSGLESINLAAQMIRAEEADVVVAGGIENMSMTPYLLRNVRWDGLRMGAGVIDDTLVEGLSCPVHHYHMGVTPENVATAFEVSREDQDQLAVLSHQRAVKAMEGGRFQEQMVAVSVPQRRGDSVVVQQDEQPRADVTLERLATLSPAFKEGGTVTAGMPQASTMQRHRWSSWQRKRPGLWALHPSWRGCPGPLPVSIRPLWAPGPCPPCARS